MDKIRHLPTLVTERPKYGGNGDPVIELPSYDRRGDEFTFDFTLPDSNFFQRFRRQLHTAYRNWELISAVPSDLLVRALFAKHTLGLSKLAQINTSTDKNCDQNQPPRGIGQLALHPRLPLLAVYCLKDRRIQIYNVKTSGFLFQYGLHEASESRYTAARPVVTCLSFSNQNHLAIGLDSGTVCVIQLDLHAIAASRLSKEKKIHEHKIQNIVLLPDCDLDQNMDFLGPIVNIVFSPGCSMEDGVWLAITTQRSGLWIWNQKLNEVIRIISTEGLNQGCLQWLRLSAEPRQSSHLLPRIPQPKPSLPEEKRLSKSTVHRWTGILGDAEDITKLDEYFSPPAGLSTSQDYSQTTANPASSKLEDPYKSPNDKNQSLLILGTKSGKVRVQKLWHSSTKMQLETFVEFNPREYIPSPGRPSLRPRQANEEITHLTVRPHYTSIGEATLPILVAFNTDNSSTLHEFAVSLPFVEPTVPRLLQIRQLATTALQSLVNLSLTLTRSNYIWRPSPSREASHPIQYESRHPICPHPLQPSIKSSLTSISTPLATRADLLLATVQPNPSQSFGRPKQSHCVLITPDPQTPSFSFSSPFPIKPLAPTPPPFPHYGSTNPPATTGGYYSRMLQAQAQPNPPEDSPTRQRTTRPAVFCEHDLVCGPVAWGSSPEGKLMGAFLYHPATVLDDCAGVALFEVVG